jgi:hypothetical protein
MVNGNHCRNLTELSALQETACPSNCATGRCEQEGGLRLPSYFQSLYGGSFDLFWPPSRQQPLRTCHECFGPACVPRGHAKRLENVYCGTRKPEVIQKPRIESQRCAVIHAIQATANWFMLLKQQIVLIAKYTIADRPIGPIFGCCGSATTAVSS